VDAEPANDVAGFVEQTSYWRTFIHKSAHEAFPPGEGEFAVQSGVRPLDQARARHQPCPEPSRRIAPEERNLGLMTKPKGERPAVGVRSS
jgi:hypothetical protein